MARDVRWWILDHKGGTHAGEGYCRALGDAAKDAQGSAFLQPNGMLLIVAGGVSITLSRTIKSGSSKPSNRWGWHQAGSTTWVGGGAFGIGKSVEAIEAVNAILGPLVRRSQAGG